VSLAFLCSQVCHADIFAQAGQSTGIDPNLLRAIALQESSNNPWALNLNGVSCNRTGDLFLVNAAWRRCDSLQSAVMILAHAAQNPWLISFETPNGFSLRIWASTKTHGERIVVDNRLHGARIEKKNIKSSDIGLMQINWRHHGKNIQDARLLFDPAYNVNYGARHLSKLLSRHNIATAVGMYHAGENGHAARQKRYSHQVLHKYAQLSQ
jgi:hypothetical protein